MRPIRAHNMQENIMINHITEELHSKFNFYDTEGMTLRELKYKLATFRATAVAVENPENSWW
jgi:predicted choloylglycine hydrolase